MTSCRSDRTRVVRFCLRLYFVQNGDSVIGVTTSLSSGQQPGWSWFDSEQGQGGFLFQTGSGARGSFPPGCSGWDVELSAELHLVFGLIISGDNLYADLRLHGVSRNHFYIYVISMKAHILLLQKLKRDFIQLHKINHFPFALPKMFSKSKTGVWHRIGSLVGVLFIRVLLVIEGSVPVAHKILFKTPNVPGFTATFLTMPTKICTSPQWEKICRSTTGNQQGVEEGKGEEDD
jgi:hypothetical protein